MGWFLLVGLFCLLAVVGFFISDRPFRFAVGGIVFLIALVFVSLIVIVTWTMAAPCSAPFTDHNSVYCQNQSHAIAPVQTTEGDPFPYSDSNAQYGWYDRHNVPMSDRCYTGMTIPCTTPQWQQATGSTPPQSATEPPPTSPQAQMNANTVTITTAGDNFFLSVPRGNNSTCTWTWVEGSAAVPYSQNTFALAGQQHTLTVTGADGFSLDDFKVTCVNDFGEQYVGVSKQ